MLARVRGTPPVDTEEHKPSKLLLGAKAKVGATTQLGLGEVVYRKKKMGPGRKCIR